MQFVCNDSVLKLVNKENFIVIKTSIDGLQQAISLKDPQ
jgi:hypothetical protein